MARPLLLCTLGVGTKTIASRHLGECAGRRDECTDGSVWCRLGGVHLRDGLRVKGKGEEKVLDGGIHLRELQIKGEERKAGKIKQLK
jgi:hypothetical protein